MYQEKPFRVRPTQEVSEDIQEAAARYPDTRRVFLADGDALILKTDKILTILSELQGAFPSLERVGIYSDARGINLKSDDELRALARSKLGMIYLGLESGSDGVLAQIKKGATAAEMTQAIQRAEALGIPTSVIALLGIGGKSLSAEHAEATARVVSAMAPTYFSALTLTLVPGTPLALAAEKGEFEPLSPEESLQELATIIRGIDPKGSKRSITFRTNHASNYVPLKGELPRDRDTVLQTIDLAIKNQALRPEWMRGL